MSRPGARAQRSRMGVRSARGGGVWQSTYGQSFQGPPAYRRSKSRSTPASARPARRNSAPHAAPRPARDTFHRNNGRMATPDPSSYFAQDNQYPPPRPKLSFYDKADITVADCLQYPRVDSGNEYKYNSYEMTYADLRKRDRQQAELMQHTSKQPVRHFSDLSVGEVLNPEGVPVYAAHKHNHAHTSSGSGDFKEPQRLTTRGMAAKAQKEEGMLPVSAIIKHGNDLPNPCTMHPAQPWLSKQRGSSAYRETVDASFSPFRTTHHDAYGRNPLASGGIRQAEQPAPKSELVVNRKPFPHPLGRNRMIML